MKSKQSRVHELPLGEWKSSDVEYWESLTADPELARQQYVYATTNDCVVAGLLGRFRAAGVTDQDAQAKILVCHLARMVNELQSEIAEMI